MTGLDDAVLALQTAGPDETGELASAVARELAPGDVVLLVGDLGVGKTTFVRAAARELGVHGPVTSPTFSLANRYAGRLPVAHLDAYRLSDPDDEELGLALEVMEGAVSFVEWPDSLRAVLDARLTVTMEHQGGDMRLIRFETTDAALLARLRRLVDDTRARYRDRRTRPGTAPG